MAAFSYQHHHPFLLDSVFLPNTTPVKVSGFMEEGNDINNTHFFSQFYPPKSLQDTPLDARIPATSCLDHSSKVALSDNEPSVTKKQSTDSSTVVDKLESGEQVTQNLPHMDKKRKNWNGYFANSARSKDASEVKSKKQKKFKASQKDEDENKFQADKKEKKIVSDEQPPTGYIHVRARRGQATDSHSLAERVRREKISERMKILQKLVPGCDKVTGKALMLDEIINYVQSLQHQVEFLSMKLASVNPMFYDFGMDLDAFMVRPERLNAISSPLSSMPQCGPALLTTFADTATTFTTTDNYPVIESATASLLLQQGQRPTAFSQDNGSLFWNVEDQKQRSLNPYEFTNNLCSFH